MTKHSKHVDEEVETAVEEEAAPAPPPRYVHFCSTCREHLGIPETPTAVRTVCDNCGSNTLTTQHLVTDEVDAALAAS